MKKKSSVHWSLDHKNTAPNVAGSSYKFHSGSHIQGEAPSIFVGRHGYPHVQVGFLSVPEYIDQDNSDAWVNKKYTIPKIAHLRSSLLHARFTQDVHQQSQLLELSQEVAMAKKPADMEIALQKKALPGYNSSSYHAPFGPTIDLKKADITSHVKVPRAIDKAVSDTDLKASVALEELYHNNITQSKLTSLLTAGTLGVKRKIVPTRWSITAVDDTLGKHLLPSIRLHDTAGVRAHFGSYLGNYFIVLFLEGSFSYELFEMHTSSPSYTTDYESYDGRRSYVSQTAGGYYAARLPILENLDQRKEQSKVLLLRFITNEYTTPLGVWVVRQAVRNALDSPAINFDSDELALSYAQKLAHKKFGYSLNHILAHAQTLKTYQSRLSQFKNA